MKLRAIITATAMVVAMAASTASAATFSGEFWDVDTGGTGDPANNIIDNLADALSIVEGANTRAADATFLSSGIDYPTGPVGPGATSDTLATWLGADASTLSGENSTSMLGSIFRFTGSIFVDAGINTFSVGADDGYRLTIDGVEVGSFGGTRAFTSTDHDFNNVGAAGARSFELLFYEDNEVAVGIDFRKAGEVVAPVPLPAAGLMLLAGLGGLAAMKRRKDKVTA